MKTIEEIKKFFPNHKFEDDFDLKLIQFTAEDLIDFSEDYAKKVAIASLEKASNNLRQASGSFNSDFYSQKRKYSFMKTLELKLKKDVLIVDAENGFYIFKIYDDEIGFISIENGTSRKELVKGSYKFLCKGSELTEEIASELVETTWIHDKKILCKYKNYNSEGDGSYFSAVKSFISAVESKDFHWLENPIEIIERGEDTEHNRVLNQNEWQEAEEKTFKNPLIFVKK